MIGEWRFDQGAGIYVHNDALPGSRPNLVNLFRYSESNFARWSSAVGSPTRTDNADSSPDGDTTATCGNFVGCHWKTKDRIRPLGIIPTKELKVARQHIHRVLDPIWQSGKMPRGKVYAAVDFGVTADGHTLLVEVNDAYCLGCMNLPSAEYTDMLQDRWVELLTGRCT